MTTLRLVSLLALGAAATALGACGEDFDPYNRVKTLRVLGIAADPPNPAPGATTTLSALVYTPGGEPVTFAWSWCPYAGSSNDGYPCLVTEAQLGMLAGAGAALPPFDLGTNATASLPHAVDPAALEAICNGTIGGAPSVGGTAALPDCENGFPITVKLTVRTATDEIVSVRQVRLRFGNIPANHNPQINGLVATIDNRDAPLDDTAMLTFPRNEQTVVKALVPPSESEPSTMKDENGQVIPTREKLILSWFIESGSTKDDRTSFIDGLVDLDKALTNKWKPAKTKDYAPTTARIFVVLRDDRGGVSWTSGTVNLGATP